MLDNGTVVKARTQALPAGQNHGQTAHGIAYHPWLMPKQDFVRIARADAKRYASLL